MKKTETGLNSLPEGNVRTGASRIMKVCVSKGMPAPTLSPLAKKNGAALTFLFKGLRLSIHLTETEVSVKLTGGRLDGMEYMFNVPNARNAEEFAETVWYCVNRGADGDPDRDRVAEKRYTKAVDKMTGEPVYGTAVRCGARVFILGPNEAKLSEGLPGPTGFREVIPGSDSEGTLSKDSEGTEIFDGDILTISWAPQIRWTARNLFHGGSCASYAVIEAEDGGGLLYCPLPLFCDTNPVTVVPAKDNVRP